MTEFPGALKIGLAGLTAALLLSTPATITAQQTNAAASSQRQFLDRYCAACHNGRVKMGGLSLAPLDLSIPGAHERLNPEDDPPAAAEAPGAPQCSTGLRLRMKQEEFSPIP